jgi:hypothetical protein
MARTWTRGSTNSGGWNSSKRGEKAQAFLLKAGDQAGKMAADGEACALCLQAFEACSLTFGESWDPLERASLERKMGEAFYRTSDYPKSREYLYHSLELLGLAFPSRPAALSLAIVKEAFVQLGHRLFPVRKVPGPGKEPRAQDREGEEVVKAASPWAGASCFTAR